MKIFPVYRNGNFKSYGSKNKYNSGSKGKYDSDNSYGYKNNKYNDYSDDYDYRKKRSYDSYGSTVEQVPIVVSEQRFLTQPQQYQVETPSYGSYQQQQPRLIPTEVITRPVVQRM